MSSERKRHRFVIPTADRVRSVCAMVYEVAREAIAGGAVEITISRVKSRRTLDQNARMWATLGEIAQQVPWVVDGRETMLTSEEWKDIFTAALRKEMRVAQGIDGGIVLLGRRTSRMTVQEMADLIELMQAFCAERNVRLIDRRYTDYWQEAA